MHIEGRDIGETNRFLNELLDSLNSALFIVDRDVKIQFYNQNCADLFNRSGTEMLDQLCGNGLGCIYVANTGMLCGTTPFCTDCVIRKSILATFLENVPSTRQLVKRDFMADGAKVTKSLMITSRFVVLNGKEMVLLIIDDVTDFQEQQEKLEEANRGLDLANKMMHQQLQVARTIQVELMPKEFPESDYFRIAALYRPFEELGGDYYDFYQFSSEKLSFYISDVSGHGVSSALISTMQKPLISSYFKFNLSPDDILKRMNNTLYHFLGDEGFFLTAVYANIDFEKMVLEYSTAAHPDMVLIREDGTHKLLPGEKKDYIIGMFPVSEYRIFREELRHGDRLIIYTDGVVESANAGHEMFGVERLVRSVEESRSLAPALALEHIQESVTRFSSQENMDDDFTIMMVEVI